MSAGMKRVPWARLKLHKEQVLASRLLFDNVVYVGSGDQCQFFIRDASRVLCRLRRLCEQPDRCELNVMGKKGLVQLNGSKLQKGHACHLVRGDKIVFCKLAYIFHPEAPFSESAISAFKDGLKQGIIGPDDIQCTLDNFPYYLNENTKTILSSFASVHFEKFIHMDKELTKKLSGISSLNPRVLLSGPSGSEIYLETLIKALAKHFGARLLIVDSLQLPDSSGYRQVETLGVVELMEVISEQGVSSTLIVLLKDLEKTLTGRKESHAPLGNELPHGVLIIGTQTEKDTNDMGSSRMKRPNNIFPNKISIQLPEDDGELSELNKLLRTEAENLRGQANAVNLRKFLTDRGMECDNIEELPIKDQLLTHDEMDKVVGTAVCYHFSHNEPNIPGDANLILSTESLSYGLRGIKSMESSSSKKELKDLVENEYEREILSDIIEPDNIQVSFDDIGALEDVKKTLKDLIILPLRRPGLFSREQLLKTAKGLLFFGPPGTGKTMLAKAVATESGAKFINIEMSRIMSKWLGDGEKYVKAIFSLASKASPCVIFIDEVESMLGTRESRVEHEIKRRMKNEFMVHWDGLRTKDKERVLVLGATNRPFDLDEAVIRRFSHRERILEQILFKEELAPDVDLKLLANTTDGFSGSDLKDLCMTAALRRIPELLEREKEEACLAKDEGRPEPALLGNDAIPPLSMKHLTSARDQGGASFSSESNTMSALIQWNNLYGDGGSKRKKNLSYFM
ncbi:katanin p60 ATPase-containing subunit A-like 2 isoform X1 [Triticum dicoccoides]|uniref:katanin p60 ATPase-containing subunit A-like 2 isoform X1 n=1 Tax=Triticum dicoccoides TaxID=85692 RepID=UPI000E7CC163|nr:katanin p60 ATPase-containing subunit A-like 2 isoform X1 [Triticum dicoccoides]XP_037455788.1 katanin p60 ATPase-containing subunit A-like 2 isoform X1 [Triticum dicoccoides]